MVFSTASYDGSVDDIGSWLSWNKALYFRKGTFIHCFQIFGYRPTVLKTHFLDQG